MKFTSLIVGKGAFVPLISNPSPLEISFLLTFRVIYVGTLLKWTKRSRPHPSPLCWYRRRRHDLRKKIASLLFVSISQPKFMRYLGVARGRSFGCDTEAYSSSLLWNFFTWPYLLTWMSLISHRGRWVVKNVYNTSFPDLEIFEKKKG